MNTDPDSYEDNVPDASELLDFELIAKSQPDKGQGLWLWVVLVLIVAGGGWAAWLYLQSQNADDMAAASNNVPMILAPKFALKEKPTDPGGMKVPDRDKLVYDRMAGEQDTGSGGAGQVERLLPPPETPLEPPKSLPPSMAEPLSQEAMPSEIDAPAPEMVPAAPAPEPDKTAAKAQVKVMEPSKGPVNIIAPKTDVKPEAKAAPVVKPAPAPTPASAPAPAAASATTKATGTAGQGFMIQLSAVRNESDAKSEWARLVKAHPDVLGGLELVIQRADLGAKGIFYRVRGGWFADRNEAKTICDELKKRNVGCLLAKP